ncbi:MAG TPA: FeoB-associated Cys-rich membrane protein [Spirochaetes bacterium]|nr:FeoB-associated Cys-rich membrane protein [Spirochaetota bacterium]
MQEVVLAIIVLLAAAYAIYKIVKSFTGRNECACANCPIKDCDKRVS